MKTQSKSKVGVPDFLSGGGETGARMRAHDWSATPLGPPESWPQSLKTVVNILLTSRFQMWMGWGEDLSFFYNDAYRPTLGIKVAMALGASATEVWKEIWQDIGPRIARVLETGEATWDEGLLLLLERSGYPEETYHTFSYSPLSDDDGKRAGILCVVTEETERIIGERRLSTLRELASRISGKNTREEVRQAIEESVRTNLKDLPFTLTYLLDENGNANLFCATGVSAGDAIAPARIDADSINALWPLADALAGHATIAVDDLSQRFPAIPSGAWDLPPREAAIAPIARQGDGTPVGFLIVGLNPYRRNDDTYRGFINLLAGQIASGLANADAYEQERRRAEALAEIDRAKTAFFSNASHEFRTPLTLMLSPLEDILARQRLEAALTVERPELELMRRNGIRLLKLVNTLLDFSRIEAGRMQSVFEPVDLAAYTAELASTFRSAMDRAGLKFVVACSPLAQPVFVDRDMWEKIVLNLLSNAFKFTLEGTISVTLQPTPDGRSVRLDVRDSGVGIPAAELPRLFERFHRVSDQRGRTQEGTGIGLALVQELVRLHGGEVRAESEPGQGTCFTVTIPLGSAHLPADQLIAGRARPTARITADAFLEEALRWLPAEPDARDEHTAEILDAPREVTSKRQTILLADDNADMREYVRRLLGDRYTVELAQDGQHALEAARRRRPDLILSDVMMPLLDGFGLLRAVRDDEALRDVPVILLSARAGEEASVEGLNAGADDYLVKPFSARELLARVRANIDMATLRREALALENALRLEAQAARERAETILSSISDGFFALDRDWRFTYVNAAAERMLGQAREELIGKSHWAVYPADAGSPLDVNYRRAMQERVSVAFENYYEPWERWFDIRTSPSGDGGLSVYFQDITDRKAAEQALHRLNETLEVQVAERTRELQAKESQLRQSQKMEAIGLLTGGVAHDFNNLLTIIRSSSDLLRLRNLPEDRRRRYVDAISDTADRAAKLTGQLLAFSRRQALNPRVFDAVAQIEGIAEMLETVVGSRIRLEIDAAERPLAIEADPSQFETALVNLAANARDAIADGGFLRVRIARDNADPGGTGRPGHAVTVTVSDTGCGIAPDRIDKIFEPFFTTKDVGRGTGLGLSQVYGFARQSGGTVTVESELGKGTTFTIRLPATDKAIAVVENADGHTASLPAARGRVLVVEDNAEVGEFSSQLLSELGYEAVLVGSAKEALKALESGTPRFDMVFSDVVMPEMDGVSLGREIRRRLPRMPVVLTSGYSQTLVDEGSHGFELLRKPYSVEELSGVLRRTMAQRLPQ